MTIMAVVCMARWMAGTGSDLKPSCLLSFPLSPLFSAILLAYFMHIVTGCFSSSTSLPLLFQAFPFAYIAALSLSLLSSLASIAIQYGLLVSAGAKAPLREESIQWNEGICEALHCFMYSCSIMGHFRQAGEKRGSQAWGSESPGFTWSCWI